MIAHWIRLKRFILKTFRNLTRSTSHNMEGRKRVRMDIEYIAMRRRISRIRVKCGKHASYEGNCLCIHLSFLTHLDHKAHKVSLSDTHAPSSIFVVVHKFQTSSPLKPPGQSNRVRPLGRGTESWYKWSRSDGQGGRQDYK